MSEYPSAEQFYALSEVGELYRNNFSAAWHDAVECRAVPIEEQRIAELVKIATEISEDAFVSSLSGERGCVFEWLACRPEFILAKQAVGFRPLESDGYSGRFEGLIRGVRDLGYVQRSLSRISSRYLDYVAGVSRAAAGFLSGQTVRSALESGATFHRMRELVTEFNQLLEVDWMNESEKGPIRGNLRSLSRCIERHQPPTPTTKRNDADLPARLMADELIQLHQRMFSATHKRAVFNLMGLPFIERPLEIRTIERLAKSGKERRLAAQVRAT